MFKTLFAGNGLLDLPVLVMLGFFAVFLGVVVWALSRRRKSHFDEMARLPLDDD